MFKILQGCFFGPVEFFVNITAQHARNVSPVNWQNSLWIGFFGCFRIWRIRQYHQHLVAAGTTDPDGTLEGIDTGF